MTYGEIVLTLREPLADMSWFDNLTLPYGKYKGVRLADLYQKDSEYFRWFKQHWMERTISKDNYEDELVFAQGLVILWNEGYYTEKYSKDFERMKGGLCFG